MIDDNLAGIKLMENFLRIEECQQRIFDSYSCVPDEMIPKYQNVEQLFRNGWNILAKADQIKVGKDIAKNTSGKACRKSEFPFKNRRKRSENLSSKVEIGILKFEF